MADLYLGKGGDLVERLADGFDALIKEVQLLKARETQLERLLHEARITYSDIEKSNIERRQKQVIDEGVSALYTYRRSSRRRDTKCIIEQRNGNWADSKDDAVLMPPGHPVIDSKSSQSQRCPFSPPSQPQLAPGDAIKHYQHRRSSFPPSPPITQKLTSPDATSPRPQQSCCSPSSSFSAVRRSESRPGPAPSRCPIRFLDTLSPEQLSTYFRTHRHEIPRSHEVCVRRYQNTDQATLREMDQKYGGGGEGAAGLGGMIKGLGAMHRGLLPGEQEKEREGEEIDDTGKDEAGEKVDKWVRGVDTVSPVKDGPATVYVGVDRSDQPEVEEQETRVSHFDRDQPLREIRLGESPSRPWGISVPATAFDKATTATPTVSNAETMAKKSQEHESPKRPLIINIARGDAPRNKSLDGQVESEKGQQQQQHCSHAEKDDNITTNRNAVPFSSCTSSSNTTPTSAAVAGYGNDAEPGPLQYLPEQPEINQLPRLSDKENTKTIFTGPIIIGYAPDEAARFLRELGLVSGS